MRAQRADLLDRLIGASEQGGRDSDAKRFGGLEVDSHLEFDRQLNRKLRRHCATEDDIDIASCLTVKIYEVRSIGN